MRGKRRDLPSLISAAFWIIAAPFCILFSILGAAFLWVALFLPIFQAAYGCTSAAVDYAQNHEKYARERQALDARIEEFRRRMEREQAAK